MFNIVLTDQSNGECFISENEINPLKLTSRPGAMEPLLENLEMDPFLTTGKLSVSSTEKEYNETKKTIEFSTAAENKVRRRRDSEIVKAEAYTDKDGQRKHVVNMVSNAFLFNRTYVRFSGPNDCDAGSYIPIG